MPLVTNRWSPDTCDCIIEYTWDDDGSPPENRIHIPSNIVTKCPAHQTVATTEEVYDTVLNKENRRKNLAFQLALDNTPEGLLYILDQNSQKLLKQGITYEFNFTGVAPNRVLNIKFNGVTLTANQRNGVQNKIDELYGAGNVVLSI